MLWGCRAFLYDVGDLHSSDELAYNHMDSCMGLYEHQKTGPIKMQLALEDFKA